MDDFVPPETHENKNLVYVSAKDQEEIRRIIGPITDSDRDFMKKLEKKIQQDEKLAEEKSRRRLEILERKLEDVERILDEDIEFDRRKPRFKVTINSELAEWKRFQKLPEAEKEAKIAESCEEIKRYLLTRETFLDDLQKRFKINIDQCDLENSDSDTENELSESESGDSEDSEGTEEEEEPEDWREAWLKMTGEPWIDCARQKSSEKSNPDSKLTIVDAVKREYNFVPLSMPKKEESVGRERKVEKPSLFDPAGPEDFSHFQFFEYQQSTVPSEEKKLFGTFPPRPNRLDSDSDVSVSSGGSADCTLQSNALDDFFGSRPSTPINRETPEKLVPDFGQHRFPTPEILDSEVTTTSRILMRTPKMENLRGKASKIAQKRAKSQIPTTKTVPTKRAKSTTVGKREMPRRAARERDITYFEAGTKETEKKFPDRKTAKRTIKKGHP